MSSYFVYSVNLETLSLQLNWDTTSIFLFAPFLFKLGTKSNDGTQQMFGAKGPRLHHTGNYTYILLNTLSKLPLIVFQLYSSNSSLASRGWYDKLKAFITLKM